MVVSFGKLSIDIDKSSFSCLINDQLSIMFSSYYLPESDGEHTGQDVEVEEEGEPGRGLKKYKYFFFGSDPEEKTDQDQEV